MVLGQGAGDGGYVLTSRETKRRCFLGLFLEVVVRSEKTGKRGLCSPPGQYGLAVPVSIDSVDPGDLVSVRYVPGRVRSCTVIWSRVPG